MKKKLLLTLLALPLTYVLLGVDGCPTKTTISACQPLYTAGALECFTANVYFKNLPGAPINQSPPNNANWGTITFYDNLSRSVLGTVPAHLYYNPNTGTVYLTGTYCKVFSQNSVDVLAIYSGVTGNTGGTSPTRLTIDPSKSNDVAVFKTNQPGFNCDLGD